MLVQELLDGDGLVLGGRRRSAFKQFLAYEASSAGSAEGCHLEGRGETWSKDASKR